MSESRYQSLVDRPAEAFRMVAMEFRQGPIPFRSSEEDEKQLLPMIMP